MPNTFRLTLPVTALVVGLLAATLLAPPSSADDREAVATGIQVHGDWTIEVFDADGNSAHRYEFDNALTPEGADLLVRLLFGTNCAGTRLIQLAGDTGVDQVPTTVGGYDLDPNGLIRTVKLESIVKWSASELPAFSTVQTTVDAYTTSDCSGTPRDRLVFTSHDLDTPIAPSIGQVVQIVVELSFS